ncbi:MAG: DNA/RNA non-specific endonuclease, partial [Gelidibacter sp.]|nr:DNA/RNA non-specific endonuclease [Gelidibacter sp.]
MSKKTLYSLVAILIVLGVYGYEYFLKVEEHSEIVEKGEVPKNETNEFFLPTSTTGQIVHHQGYSLSYDEPFEQ